MHSTSSRARPIEFVSADAGHVIASVGVGSRGTVLHRPPDIAGKWPCRQKKLWIDIGRFPKIDINRANDSPKGGKSFLHGLGGPLSMETFGWIDMDVLPILIPTLSGPAGPRLDLAKRCPSFGITFFRDCFQPIPSQEHYSIEVFDIPSTNGKKRNR